jgi:hypothetical protein
MMSDTQIILITGASHSQEFAQALHLPPIGTCQSAWVAGFKLMYP